LSEVTAIAHPNFALVKYWGKADSVSNKPAMSSISLTIDTLTSTTKISRNQGSSENIWMLNGEEQNNLARINPVLKYLNNISRNNYGCIIKSENNFPTSAGLASSASGIASLVIAYNQFFKLSMNFDQLVEASMIGSGSAPRSLLGGFVILNVEDQVTSQTILEPEEWPLSIIICITDEKEKIVSSREGMEISRKTSPLYQSWLDSNKEDIQIAKSAIAENNLRRLGEVAEKNCYLMHEVMRTSSPKIRYMTENTNNCIKQIKTIRKEGVDLFFTVDAGPQVKIVCKTEDKDSIKAKFLNKPYAMKILEANIGLGARVIHEG
tara:strand:+ start:319 stop:1284 length:966 start_codon:yes stop_codon:yes gene_type:complete